MLVSIQAEKLVEEKNLYQVRKLIYIMQGAVVSYIKPAQINLVVARKV